MLKNKMQTNSFIVTLTGPSGCGKSVVMNKIMELQDLLGQEGIHFAPEIFPKYVTRPLRRKEIKERIEGKTIDVEYVESIPDDCDLRYQTYGKRYAIRLQDLRNLLDNDKSPLVVINDVRALEELKREFPNRVLALFVFREIPNKASFEKEAKDRGGGAIQEAEDRFNKATAIYRTYIENIGLFNRVILNVGTNSTPDYAKIQIETLIRGILKGNLSLSSKRDGKPKLFIIAGHAKSGKDEIIKAIDDMGRLQAAIVRKYTSRRQDEDDGKEMICRLIPSKVLLAQFIEEFKTELKNIDVEYEKLVATSNNDVDTLTNAAEWRHQEQRRLIRPNDRFWKLLAEKEDDLANTIRTRLVEETADCHKLSGMDLYSMSLDELKALYCKDGYHDKSIVPDDVCAQWDGQTIIDKLIEETIVENDVTDDKVGNIEKLNDLIALYKKPGYHAWDADIDYPDKEKKRIEDELFTTNPDYIDLVALLDRHIMSEDDDKKPVKFNADDKACYLQEGERGFILYENNKTLYGFEVYNVALKTKTLLKKLNDDNKHLVLVASLPEIFKWCDKCTDGNIVTVFAHSEISVEEFKKIATSDAAIRKLGNYPKEILKYSNNIDLFDHVTIFAENKSDAKTGAREEELFDQMFRLFRFYN